jgi:phosphatidylglycerophosphatase A
MTFATGFGTGYLPRIPGTIGTLLAALVYWYGLSHLAPTYYLLITTAIIVAGIPISGRAELISNKKDDPKIVIDEIAGYLITMLFIQKTLLLTLAGFVLFRFFDIVKPFGIKKLQRLNGGTGIMIDDIACGLITNFLLRVISFFI